MIATRNQLLRWAAEQRISLEDLPAAMRVVGVQPNGNDWRRLFDAMALWLGSLFVSVSVIFFFAYNWSDLGRLSKFALVELPLLVSAGVAIWKGPHTDAHRAALLVATLLVGALLALIGQTYQTGADPWQLFALWAALILPWVVIARMPALWILWLGLINLSLTLYYTTFGGLFGVLFSGNEIAWVLLVVNLSALVVWHYFSSTASTQRPGRWALRLLATACGILITTLMMYGILDGQDLLPATVVWIALMWAAHEVYRRRQPDLFVLAGCVLSAVFVLTATLSRLLLDTVVESAGALLLVGLTIIALSAAGAWWLRSVAAELDP